MLVDDRLIHLQSAVRRADSSGLVEDAQRFTLGCELERRLLHRVLETAQHDPVIACCPLIRAIDFVQRPADLGSASIGLQRAGAVAEILQIWIAEDVADMPVGEHHVAAPRDVVRIGSNQLLHFRLFLLSKKLPAGKCGGPLQRNKSGV